MMVKYQKLPNLGRHSTYSLRQPRGDNTPEEPFYDVSMTEDYPSEVVTSCNVYKFVLLGAVQAPAVKHQPEKLPSKNLDDMENDSASNKAESVKSNSDDDD